VAHRNILWLIDRHGVLLEKLEENPAALLKSRLNTTEPVTEICRVSYNRQRPPLGILDGDRRQYGSRYLISAGGAATLIASRNIVS
jgi:hypothetical protein